MRTRLPGSTIHPHASGPTTHTTKTARHRRQRKSRSKRPRTSRTTGIAMRPPVPAVREQVAVDADHCLKAYLLHTFQKRIDVTAAEKFLSTFRTQQAKQTCTAFIDVFVTKFEYYITVSWTAAESELQGKCRFNSLTIRRGSTRTVVICRRTRTKRRIQ